MALECDPPHLGDIGDEPPEPEPDIDAEYEAWRMKQLEEEREGGD